MITEKVVTAAYCNTGNDIFDIFGMLLKLLLFVVKNVRSQTTNLPKMSLPVLQC
jgi:hypothetical protein